MVFEFLTERGQPAGKLSGLGQPMTDELQTPQEETWAQETGGRNDQQEDMSKMIAGEMQSLNPQVGLNLTSYLRKDLPP